MSPRPPGGRASPRRRAGARRPECLGGNPGCTPGRGSRTPHRLGIRSRLPGAAFLGAFLLLALLTGCGGDDAGPRTCTWDESRWDECQWAE